MDKKINPRMEARRKNKPFYEFLCQDCNNIFKNSFDSVSNGVWCPFCKNKTEKILYDFLK